MSRKPTPARHALQAFALLCLLASNAAWAQPQSCASQAAAANAITPGFDQRLRENAQQFDADFLRERIARAKLAAKDDPSKALTACIFEQELAARSGGSSSSASSTAPPAAGRDDPKVFGRTARGG